MTEIDTHITGDDGLELEVTATGEFQAAERQTYWEPGHAAHMENVEVYDAHDWPITDQVCDEDMERVEHELLEAHDSRVEFWEEE